MSDIDDVFAELAAMPAAEFDEVIRKHEATKKPKLEVLPAPKKRAKTVARGRKMSRARRQTKGDVQISGLFWVGRHRVDGADGKRTWCQFRRIGEVDKMSRTQAQEAYFQAFIRQSNVDSQNPSSLTTLKDFVQTIFIPNHLTKLAAKTQKSYNDDLRNHVLPRLGDLPMRDISRAKIQALLNDMIKAGLRRPSRLNVRALISKVFTVAVQTEFYIGDKPTSFLDVGPHDSKPRQFLEPAQFQKLLAAIKHPETRLLCLLGLDSGMNIAEMAGLPMRYCNLSDKTVMVATVFGDLFQVALAPRSIFVHQQWSLGKIGPVKKKARNRILPLSDKLVAELKAYTTRERFTDANSFVFSSRTGTPADEHNLAARHLKPAAITAGVPWMSWHDLRRLHASAMQAVGIVPSDRLAGMGHRDLAMTALYTGDVVESRRPGVEKIQEWAAGQS